MNLSISSAAPHYANEATAFFKISIDPTHSGVRPFFFEKGTYKFVMQVSAPDAGKPEQLTILVDWDEKDITIRSADGKILETSK
jgi:hypothetical protein